MSANGIYKGIDKKENGVNVDCIDYVEEVTE